MLTPDQINQLKGTSSGITPGGVSNDLSDDTAYNNWKNSVMAKGQQETPNVAENPLDKTNPIIQTLNQAEGGLNRFGEGFNMTKDAMHSKSLGEGLQKVGVGVMKEIGGGIQALSSPISGTLSAASNFPGVSQIVDAVKKYAVDPSSDAFSKSPALQRFMTENPNADSVVQDLISLVTTLVGGRNSGEIKSVTEPIVSPVIETAQGFVKGVKENAVAAKEAIKPNPEVSFQNAVNDVLPVLKNDVRNLPKKYENMRTALGDIVDNKESLGLTDKNGAPRLPENFEETTQAQDARMKQIYKDYSAKLQGIDKEKFDTDIKTQIASQIETVKAQLEKENSLSGRKALSSKLQELSTLRDTSPEGIQNYIEILNQEAKTAPGAPLSVKQIKAANLAGEMRKVLDQSVEKIDGPGYQELRNTYGAHRALRDQFLMAAKKEINNTPALMDKLTALGISVEGLNFLLTHNPKSLLVAAGVKGSSAIMKWFNSPQRALGKLYKGLESGDYRIKPPSSSEENMSQSANIEPSNTNIK